MNKRKEIMRKAAEDFDVDSEMISITTYQNPRIWLKDYQVETLGYKIIKTDSLLRAYLSEDVIEYLPFKTKALIPIKNQYEILMGMYQRRFFTFMNNQRLVNYHSFRLLQEKAPKDNQFAQIMSVLTYPKVKMTDDVNAPYLFMGEEYDSFKEEVAESSEIVTEFLNKPSKTRVMVKPMASMK